MLLVMLFCCGQTPAAPVPLCSSVLLLDERRLDAAVQLVDRAVLTGGGRVQVVVNLHAQLDEELRPVAWGLLRDHRRPHDAPENFRPLDESLSLKLRSRLQAAFRRTAELGVDVSVVPHLDAAGPVGEWRNFIDLDPLAIVDGHSYQSALLEPIANALVQTTSQSQRVWVCLGGEMGRSLFRYPGSYDRILKISRSELDGLNTNIGVSLNFSEVGGGAVLDELRTIELQGLMEKLDFVGVSCYRPIQLPIVSAHFDETLRGFRKEFEGNGLRLPEGVAILLSEVAVGGAEDASGRFTPQATAAEPWQGVGAGGDNPWRDPKMAAFRRQYYRAVLDFLSSAPEAEPEAAFLWSEGSWEPMGVDGPGFVDRLIVRDILRHNRRAEAAASGPPQRP